MIRKIIISLLLGLFITVLYLPHDPFFKQMIAQQFTQIFNNAFNCKLSFKQVHIDLWKPMLRFEDMQVEPILGSEWKWGATHYSMRCSWWHIFTQHTLDLDMGLENFKAESEYYDGALAIESHVKKMIVGKPIIPITLMQLQINDASIVIMKNGIQIGSFAWNASVHEQNEALHIALQLLDGSVSLESITFKKLAASLRGQFHPTQAGFTLYGTSMFDAQTQPCAFTASLIDDQIRFDISGQDGMHLDMAYCLQDQKGDFAVAVPLENVKSLASIAGYNVPELQGKFNVHGAYSFDEKLRIDTAYTCNARAYQKELSTSGSLTMVQNKLNIKGASDTLSYHIDFDTDKKIIEKAQIAHEGKPFFTACQTEQSHYTLDTNLELICSVLKIDALIKGHMHAYLYLRENHCVIDFYSKELFALVPHTFYSVKKATGLVDICLSDRSIAIGNLNIMFDQGNIFCSHGSFQLDTNYHCVNASLPWKIITMPLKIDPNISGAISGQLTIQKHGINAPKISGALLIDDAKINALEYFWDFSCTQVNGQFPFEIDADIKIATRKPAHINMPLLKGDLIANLHIQNTFNTLTFTGSCELQKGILQLPYKPLYLEKAELTFAKNESMPLIHVAGLNTIKQHDIAIQIIGPLNKCQIFISSDPYLESDKIIALLLTGNPGSALTTLMPAVAGQAVCDYLNYETKNFWFKFPEYVRLVPHFDDQSARGGIRAAFEIVVTDQFRALIQKNFSLTEDTRLQVEYDVTDDIVLRATRDERRDLNAEVQMRWKF